MPHDVFISHATDNKAIADAICSYLERGQIRCWMAPRDIPAGKTWSAEITKAIRQCRVMVLVFTSATNASRFVAAEVTTAANHSKPILAFRTEDVRPSDDLDLHLAATHWRDALTPPLEDHIGLLTVDVQMLLGGGTSEPLKNNGAAASRRKINWAGLIPAKVWAPTVLMAMALCAALWAPWRTPTQVERPLVRLDVELGPDVSLPGFSAGGTSVAISPDGMRLAFVSGAPTKLYTRRLDQPRATELPETQGAQTPFFSPDGQWIGFLASNKLKKISVDGGAVVPLAEINNFAGASWGEDGRIVVSEGFTKGLVRIPSSGGTQETLAGLRNGERALALPQILPGSKAILFTAVTALDVDKSTIEILTILDGKRKLLLHGGTSARYLPDPQGVGHLVYVNKATLFAIPFDLEKLETRGTAVPVLDDVAYQATTETGQLDFSRNGMVVYRKDSRGAPAMATLQVADPGGAGRETLRIKAGAYLSPRLSPDGKKIALTVTEGGNQDIWVYDEPKDTLTRLTFGDAVYNYPRWSPNGKYLVFSAGANGIFQAPTDAASPPRPLTQSKTRQIPVSFAPDGTRLGFDDYGAGNSQVWTVAVEEAGDHLNAGTPEAFLKGRFSDQNPAFSPDGKWIAYQSNESGNYEVYVQPSPASSNVGGKWQISNTGGTRPRWLANGRDLVYQSSSQLLIAEYVVKGNIFAAKKPRVWMAKLGGTQWDLAPGGKVLVMSTEQAGEVRKPDREVVFLENFLDELRRRALRSK